MGLDMCSSAKRSNYYRLNWTGVAWFTNQCHHRFGAEPFSNRWSGFNDGTGPNMRVKVDRLEAEAFIAAAEKWVRRTAGRKAPDGDADYDEFRGLLMKYLRFMRAAVREKAMIQYC